MTIPRSGRPVCVALLAGLAVTSCGGDDATHPAFEVIDSAGVRVVVNTRPDAGAGPEWTLPDEPALEIGVQDGAPEYQLFRVTGAAVMSDGAIVVANTGTHELRFYDGEGRYLRSVGREGDGPGEFRSVGLVGLLAGDSILVFDSRQDRGSIFDASGTLVRSFRIETAEERVWDRPVGVTTAGDVVVLRDVLYVAGQVGSGVDRASMRLSTTGPEGSLKASLGVLPGTERFVLATEDFMTVRSLMFGRGLHVAVAHDRIAVGNNDAYSVRILAADGSILHVVRQRRGPAPVREEDVRRYIDDQLAEVEDENSRRRTLSMFEQMPRRETFPAYASIELDAAGNLWVEEYRRPGEEEPVWQVFDREGVFAGRVRPPAGLRVLDIGDDYVLGVATDDLGVERLRLYHLEMP